MQGKQILLTIALVATGIFGYDLLRAGPREPDLQPPPESTVVTTSEAPRLASGWQGAPPPSPVEEVARLGAELEETRRRLREVEAAWGAMRTEWQAVLAQARARTPAAAPDDGSDTDTAPLPAGAWLYGPEEEARALRMLAAADQARKREYLASSVATELQHMPVDLTSEQRQEIVAATLTHRARTDRILAQLPKDVGWDGRAEALRPVHDDFLRAIDAIVAGPDSRAVADRLQYQAVPGAAGQDPQVAGAQLR